jgi:hypothetical protein
MTKITKLDRTSLQALRSPIETVLLALGNELGLSLKLGNGSFGDGAEASFKLILKVDDPAVKSAAEKANWDRNCRYIGVDYNDFENSGLRPEDFGTEFSYSAQTYRTTGIAVKGKNSSKFPILCEIVSGKDAGSIRMLPERAVPIIRAATDAAAKPKGKKAA